MTTSHRSEDVADESNQKALDELAWAIEWNGGQFALILARCNSASLQKGLVQTLQELCSVEIRQRVLEQSFKLLYGNLQTELGQNKPQALMIFGLESVSDLDQLLTAANQVREEFRKNFHFPLVLWVTDEVLQKLIRLAPDFYSWATTVEFAIASEELIQFIQQTADEVFAKVLDVGAGIFLDNVALNLEIGSPLRTELELAHKELQNCGVKLDPELEASLEFVLGRAADGSLEQSRQHYERSLALWQQQQRSQKENFESDNESENIPPLTPPYQGRDRGGQNPKPLERQGCLLNCLGLWWYTDAQRHPARYSQSYGRAKDYFQQCVEVFEQAERPELVAKFINALGDVLQRLQQWDELEAVAKKALALHQTYPDSFRLINEVNEVIALSKSSEALFASHQELEALIEAIRARKKLQQLGRADADTRLQVVKALQPLLYRIKEYNRLEGHRGWVKAVSISRDGQMIASASKDKTVKLWKKDGTLLKTLAGHGGEVNAVSISPDGQMIASASDDTTVKLWRRDGTLLKTLDKHKREVKAVSISPDGQMIASASWDKTVKLWKKDGTLFKTLDGDMAEQSTVSFSADGQMIASGGWNGKVKLWNKDGTRRDALIADDDYGEVYGVSFSPDGQIIATASDDKTVKLWNKDGTRRDALLKHSDVVWGVSFSPDGELIASASQDRTVKLWKRDGSLLFTLSGHSNAVRGVSFSPDGEIIASASQDGTVKLWKPGGTSLKTLQEYSTSVHAVSFSPDGQMIATAGEDKTVKLWNRDGTLLKTLTEHEDQVYAVSFSPDGQMIASGGGEGKVKLSNRDGTDRKDLKRDNNYDAVRAVSFSPDGQMIASASDDKTVKLWRRDGTLFKTLSGHDRRVNAVSISPDGEMIASASDDTTVKLWKKDGTLLRTLSGHNGRVNAVSFSPDGQMIASASDDTTVKLWKKDGTLLRVRDYLKTNVNVSESDRTLCDDIPTHK